MSGIVGGNLGRGSGLIKAGAIDDDSVTLAKMAGLARGKLIYGDTSGDPAALAVGGADEVLTHDGTDFDWAAASGGASLRPNAKPLVINGDMAVAQRATSVAGIASAGEAGYQTVDRWTADIGGTPGTWTCIQETLTSGAAYTDGFSTAFRWDCTTDDASHGASDILDLQYRIEGQDLQLFKKGTANAEAYTVAFWVKSNKTGTSQCNIYDKDNNRLCGATFTISSGDTWEHKVCNFAADTTGVLDNDNAQSMLLYFPLAAGSNYTGGAIPTAWETLSDGDLAVSNLALADSTDNDFAITGIQLEVGTYTSSTLPPFQHESYGDNLIRCQRYYETKGKYDSWVHSCYSTTIMYGYWSWITTKRTTPTITIIGTNSAYSAGAAFGGTLAVTSTRSTCFGTSFTTTGITGGRAAHVANSGSNPSITINAEL